MGRNYFLNIFILLTFLLLFLPQDARSENTLQAGLSRAERYGEEGKRDFAFLELRDLLQRYPEGPHVPEVEFGLAEYHFLQGNFLEGKEAFLRCLSKIQHDSIPRVLSQVYLLKYQEKISGSSMLAKDLLAQLKQELSSQKFFEAFDDKRTRTWQSPLGNHYTLHEFVDHLEILQNGQPFYTITLP